MFPQHSVSPADWVVEASGSAPGPGLRRLVPAGFEATLRVFHPFWDAEGLVSWEALASGGLGWDTAVPDLTVRAGLNKPNRWLDVDQAKALTAVLAGSTDGDAPVWIGSWVGWALYGQFDAYPTYRAPRECLLYRGTLATVVEEIERDSAPVVVGDPVLRPYQWWPESRAWYVVSDVDVSSTLIAGERALLERIQEVVESRFLPDEPDPDLTSLGD
jgi:hypothetical protein